MLEKKDLGIRYITDEIIHFPDNFISKKKKKNMN